MAFDIKKIRTKQFEKRTKEIEAPEFLHDGYSEDEEKIIIIQSLDMVEFVQTQQAHQRQEVEQAFFEGMNKKAAKENGENMADFFGNLNEKTDPTSTKVKEGLLLGIQYPKFTRDDIIKFCKYFPIQMLAIYHEIEMISEAGGVVAEKKPKGSGKTTTSKA